MFGKCQSSCKSQVIKIWTFNSSTVGNGIPKTNFAIIKLKEGFFPEYSINLEKNANKGEIFD